MRNPLQYLPLAGHGNVRRQRRPRMERCMLWDQNSVSLEATGRGRIALIRDRHPQALGSHPIGPPDWGAMPRRALPKEEDLRSSIHGGSEDSGDHRLWGTEGDSQPESVHSRSDSAAEPQRGRGLSERQDENPHCDAPTLREFAPRSEEGGVHLSTREPDSVLQAEPSVSGFLSYLKTTTQHTMGLHPPEPFKPEGKTFTTLTFREALSASSNDIGSGTSTCHSAWGASEVEPSTISPSARPMSVGGSRRTGRRLLCHANTSIGDRFAQMDRSTRSMTTTYR
jgi:hypothetical protein